MRKEGDKSFENIVLSGLGKIPAWLPKMISLEDHESLSVLAPGGGWLPGLLGIVSGLGQKKKSKLKKVTVTSVDLSELSSLENIQSVYEALQKVPPFDKQSSKLTVTSDRESVVLGYLGIKISIQVVKQDIVDFARECEQKFSILYIENPPIQAAAFDFGSDRPNGIRYSFAYLPRLLIEDKSWILSTCHLWLEQFQLQGLINASMKTEYIDKTTNYLTYLPFTSTSFDNRMALQFKGSVHAGPEKTFFEIQKRQMISKTIIAASVLLFFLRDLESFTPSGAALFFVTCALMLFQLFGLTRYDNTGAMTGIGALALQFGVFCVNPENIAKLSFSKN